VNSRINYPIKALLIEMQESHQFNLQDEYVKFCVLWISIQISRIGVEIFVTAWNEHPIQGMYPRNRKYIVYVHSCNTVARLSGELSGNY